MTAGDRFAGYRSDVKGAHGDGLVSNRDTLAVLRELCRVCHDSGVAQVGIVRLMTRIGVSDRTVKRALKRLQADGWLTQALRGTGNKHSTNPRESVWVLHQLPDAQGVMWPDAAWVRSAWFTYSTTPRYLRLDKHSRKAVAEAYSGVDSGAVDNRLLSDSQVPTRGQPCHHMSQEELLKTKTHTATHYREAARRRGQLRVVRTDT